MLLLDGFMMLMEILKEKCPGLRKLSVDVSYNELQDPATLAKLPTLENLECFDLSLNADLYDLHHLQTPASWSVTFPRLKALTKLNVFQAHLCH